MAAATRRDFTECFIFIPLCGLIYGLEGDALRPRSASGKRFELRNAFPTPVRVVEGAYGERGRRASHLLANIQ
jgi:hypothetical protein